MAATRCLYAFVALCLSLTPTHGYAVRADCQVKVNVDLPDPQPLLLLPDGSNDGLGFYLPDSGDTITVNSGSEIRVACPGSTNYVLPLGSSTKEASAVCVSGTTFTINGKTFNFRDLACKTIPKSTARASGQKCYNGKPIVIEIGFENGQDFIKTIDICFDEERRNTLYSQFDLVAGIAGYEVGFPRPSFIPDTFYPNMDIDNLYSRKTQTETVGKILGSTALAGQYIHPTDDYFMSRGHLTAKADFVFGSEQRATFHFVNVAPQWQTFNEANWNTLEYNVRTFAGNKATNLKVYTGTHGVTTLPDINNVEKELYLYVGNDGKMAVPVPKLYWKVVYNPKTEEGIVFLGVNNPHIPAEKLGKDYLICTDVCSKVSWLTWSPKDVKKGIAYCCDVNEFRETVDTLPPFDVSGLLT